MDEAWRVAATALDLRPSATAQLHRGLLISVLSAMPEQYLTPEHLAFYEWFKSFWTAPSGQRVAERIPPSAKIHFAGQATMSGSDYIDFMDAMLAAFPGMTVTPLDCAGSGEMLYIAWETSSIIHGQQRTFLGVDRFRIIEGMAVEEHIIFDSAVLTPEGRPGIDHLSSPARHNTISTQMAINAAEADLDVRGLRAAPLVRR